MKVIVLRLVLERFDYVMWFDGDCFIRDLRWNVTAFVQAYTPPGIEILTASDMVPGGGARESARLLEKF